MAMHQLSQHRDDAVPAEEDRYADPQPSDRLAPAGVERRLGGFDLFESLLATLVEYPAVLGQLLPTSRAVE